MRRIARIRPVTEREATAQLHPHTGQIEWVTPAVRRLYRTDPALPNDNGPAPESARPQIPLSASRANPRGK
jgi:hypothetical protein